MSLVTSWDNETVSLEEGIRLLSIAVNVYARALKRLVESQIKEEQCCFQPGQRTLDQLFILLWIFDGT